MKNEYLVMILAVLQMGDILTTERILKAGGTELNPVMNWLFNKLGISYTLVAKAILVTILGIVLMELLPLALIVLDVVYVGVVAWNSYQLWGKK